MGMLSIESPKLLNHYLNSSQSEVEVWRLELVVGVAYSRDCSIRLSKNWYLGTACMGKREANRGCSPLEAVISTFEASSKVNSRLSRLHTVAVM
jgi:hypothetical protein